MHRREIVLGSERAKENRGLAEIDRVFCSENL